MVTRPDSRDAPHLFGLGLQEMLADEMTSELRWIRAQAIARAKDIGRSAALPLVAKGIRFGDIHRTSGWHGRRVDAALWSRWTQHQPDGGHRCVTEVKRSPPATSSATLSRDSQQEVIAFLNSLVLFPPDDTASNLDPGDPSTPGFPQYGHGSIRLTVLFNNPAKIE